MKRVLVGHEDLLVGERISNGLESDGLELVVVQDGPSALAQLAGGQFDVAMLDTAMSTMTGIQVVAMLDANGLWFDRRPHLVLLTDRSPSEGQRLAKDAGFDCHVGRPFGLRELRDMVNAASPAPTVQD